MPDPLAPLRIGVLPWNQNTDWPALLEVGRRVDRLGYDSLWAWDHLNPIVGDPHGPFHESWLTLTAWAMATTRVRLGHLVGANPFRNPALVAKMATTLDHVSGGRAYLGIGAAWNEAEARDFGVEFGSGFPERLRWLGEALPILRSMLDGRIPEPGPAPRHYAIGTARNDPLPIQSHLPILVGGGGERVTLRLVARFADANNVGEGVDVVRRKEAILREHCDAIGRDHREIERTANLGIVVIRDTETEARRVFDGLMAANRIEKPPAIAPVGTPEQVFEQVAPYLELGYHHLIVRHPAPYDEETLVRFASEVRPRLEAAI